MALIVVIGDPWPGCVDHEAQELSLSAFRLLCKLSSGVDGPLRLLLTTVGTTPTDALTQVFNSIPDVRANDIVHRSIVES